jgi:aryl-alcohol dehydrogenase-like predicted oxidoreductase
VPIDTDFGTWLKNASNNDQLHMDDPVTPIDEMVGAMDTIVRSDRARYIGVSNILAYRLVKRGWTETKRVSF